MNQNQIAIIAELECRTRKNILVIFDVLLILFCLYAAFNWAWFFGGWGWFLLLGLSPRAWKRIKLT